MKLLRGQGAENSGRAQRAERAVRTARDEMGETGNGSARVGTDPLPMTNNAHSKIIVHIPLQRQHKHEL